MGSFCNIVLGMVICVVGKEICFLGKEIFVGIFRVKEWGFDVVCDY